MNPAIAGAISRARRTSRRAVATAAPVGTRAAEAARRRVPEPVRTKVSTAVLRRPWPVEVPVDQLLQGSQAGLDAVGFAALTGDLMWGSRRVADGPHAGLLRLAAGGHQPSDREILDSPYGELARQVIELRGRWFDATDDAGVLELARHALSRSQARGQALAATGARPAAASAEDAPVLVAPVVGSQYFQVLDGHHRVAEAAVAGRSSVTVTTKWLPVRTPLQHHLYRMSWLDGTTELYQPISAPELEEGWTLVRSCTDRRDAMLAFLAQEGLLPPTTTTYLDVASFYGWFVAALTDAGYEAEGIERDPLAPAVGEVMYGLDPAHVLTGDAEELLLSGRRWDVVSCFSLLHHFALGRGSVSAAELARRLDAATGKVLFFDTGQNHEAWFRQSLAEWDVPYIEAFLREHTTFDRIVRLGPDTDARGAYAENYGRMLFACVRES